MKKNEEGYVLILSMVLMIILVIMTAAMARNINNEVHIARHEENMIETQYIADAAVEYAAANIGNEDAWVSGGSYDIMNGDLTDNFAATFFESGDRLETVEKRDDGYIHEIKVTVKHKNITKTIEAVFKDSNIIDHGIFDNQLAARGKVNVHNASNEVDDSAPVRAETINDHASNVIDDANEEEGTFTEDGEENDEAKAINAIATLYDTLMADDDTYTPDKCLDGEGDKVEKIESNITSNDPITLSNEVLDLSNINYQADINIKGNGIILMNNNNQNSGTVNINFDPSDPTADPTTGFTDGYVILISRSGFPSLDMNIKGMIYSGADFNNNSNLNIQGSIISKDSINTGSKFALDFDKGFVDVLNTTLLDNGVEIPEELVENYSDDKVSYNLINWEESYSTN
ncbi:MAG: hypothetical protein ACLFPF_08310 [Halanaerobiales bacterium]